MNLMILNMVNGGDFWSFIKMNHDIEIPIERGICTLAVGQIFLLIWPSIYLISSTLDTTQTDRPALKVK